MDESNRRLVIKDSWEYKEQTKEGLLIKEATEAGVKNVAQYYHHKTVCANGKVDDVLKNVRKGLSDTVSQDLFQRRAAHYDAITSLTVLSASGPGKGRS